MTPVVHYSMGGLVVDAAGRVLRAGGEAVEGLWAAGELMGGLHGKNRLGGNALTEYVYPVPSPTRSIPIRFGRFDSDGFSHVGGGLRGFWCDSLKGRRRSRETALSKTDLVDSWLLLPHNASSAPWSSTPSLHRSIAWQAGDFAKDEARSSRRHAADAAEGETQVCGVRADGGCGHPCGQPRRRGSA